MSKETDIRIKWIKHYDASGNLEVSFQYCGISRLTFMFGGIAIRWESRGRP
jgi:hypothetical protein